MYACNGILFNHESPRRGKTFVTRKIIRAACKIKEGLQDCLYLGNLDAKRDWGYAPEFCEGMWLMLQQEKPEDYVLSTGEANTVREFVELTFNELSIDLEWRGEGRNEIAIDTKTGNKIVSIDEKYFRPTEVDILLGDSSKAKEQLGWESKTALQEIVKMMVDSDIKKIRSRGY
tara:strand:- start:3277 stop:3798 length:522 start_codon:yes stop_codon:yes gene_type:complete